MTFDEYVAIDWSGARGPRQHGIQVARCGATDDLPELVFPDARAWGRQAIYDVLKGIGSSSRRTLVGLDFAFSVPQDALIRCLGAELDSEAPVFALWQRIDDFAKGEEHFYAGSVVRCRNSPFAAYMRFPGERGAEYDHSRLRMTEGFCRPRANSVFHNIGARSVGFSSFSGMRVLHHLRRELGDKISIWPFEMQNDARLIVAEIYPSEYFQQQGAHRTNDRDEVANVLAKWGVTVATDPRTHSQDAVDAIVSAAAMRCLVNGGALEVDLHSVSRTEGWILGVK